MATFNTKDGTEITTRIGAAGGRWCSAMAGRSVVGRLGGADVLPQRARLSLHCARPPRARPLQPAVDRQRHEHVCGRPRRARRTSSTSRTPSTSGTRPAAARWRATSAATAPSASPRQCSLAQCRRSCSRRPANPAGIADRGVRSTARRRARGPLAVLQGPFAAFLRLQPQRRESLRGRARILLAAEHAGRIPGRVLPRQAFSRDRSDGGPQEVRHADAHHSRRRRSDRPPRRRSTLHQAFNAVKSTTRAPVHTLKTHQPIVLHSIHYLARARQIHSDLISHTQ